MYSKIVFVKVEWSVIEISGSVQWSWWSIGIPRNSQPNDILSTYAFQQN